MSKQQTQPNPPEIQNTRRSTPSDQLAQAVHTTSELSNSVAALRTEADRAKNVFGFGRRILVSPDEIHVVVGDGRHIWTMSNERKVFGQSAERPSRYWLNPLTQVIKLKTISFTVAINGPANRGVNALDNSKVSFQLWAHAVAKINPEKAEIAAQRVGLDATNLVHTITKVGTAELVAAAATMSLEDIIANRQALAAIAFPKVNKILSELGYDLALLTITQLDGEAYIKLIEQAESRISKETGIATNREQLAELEDDQARERVESEIQATTKKKLATERLEAEREVETATISQQESLDVHRHEMAVKQIGRKKTAVKTAHGADLEKVQLTQQIGEAEAEKKAKLAKIEAEREAELRALQQKRQAAIKLAQTDAEAERLAMEQARQIERKAALTLAEVERLRNEELESAHRVKEIALLEANQLAEALKIEAEAEARSLQIKVDTETKMELVKAEAEATATEKRAHAAKIRAEATKAETAASGLAEADVAAARVMVAEQQVAVTRAEGMAAAEVAQAQAKAEADRIRRLKEVEINAQTKLARLYDEAPILIELEKIRMQLTHEEKIIAIQTEANLKAFEAIAPGVKINLFGNGGQTGQIMNNLMSFSHGLNVMSDEIPWLNRIIGQDNGANDEPLTALRTTLTSSRVMPYLRQMMAEMNPRMFSSLKVADVVERLGSVAAGDEDLITAVTQLKQDATFRMVGNLPIGPILNLLGLNVNNGEDSSIETIEVEDIAN